MKKWMMLLFGLALTTVVAGREVPTALGRCTDHLNARVAPNTQQSALGMLAKGTAVRIIGSPDDDWFEIAAPASLDVYVAANLVRDGKTVCEVNVRSGPGIEFSRVGTVSSGTTVRLKQSYNKDWLKIEPPEGVSCFVARRYIAVSQSELSNLEKSVSDKAVKTGKGNVVGRQFQSQLPLSLRRQFVPDAGRTVTMQGVVAELKNNSSGLTHALVRSAEDSRNVLCFLSGDPVQLKALGGATVKVSGLRQIVRNWKVPILEVREIKEIE